MKALRIFFAFVLVIFMVGFGICAVSSLMFVKEAPAVLIVTAIAAACAIGCLVAARAVIKVINKPPE